MINTNGFITEYIKSTQKILSLEKMRIIEYGHIKPKEIKYNHYKIYDLFNK